MKKKPSPGSPLVVKGDSLDPKHIPYNGLKNHETWLVKLWLDRDESLSHYWGDVVRHELEKVRGNRKDASYAIARRMEDEMAGMAADIGALFGDLLRGALGRVDYDTIAHHLIAGEGK